MHFRSNGNVFRCLRIIQDFITCENRPKVIPRWLPMTAQSGQIPVKIPVKIPVTKTACTKPQATKGFKKSRVGIKTVLLQ